MPPRQVAFFEFNSGTGTVLAMMAASRYSPKPLGSTEAEGWAGK